MFSFLSLLSQGLNYFSFFNIGSRGNRILNRVYVVTGIIGDLYLFYAGVRFINNQYVFHGTLILLAATALIYFLYINFYYYFLNREAPLDVSPQIERKLGLAKFNQQAERSLNHLQNAPHRQISQTFQRSLPARMTQNSLERRNLRFLIHDLIVHHKLRVDYAGLGHRQLVNRLKHNHYQPVYAIGAGALIPAFSFRHEVVYAGSDRFHQYPVGRLASVGLKRLSQLSPASRRHLRIASIILVGGPYLIMGRSGVYERRHSYQLQINVNL